METYKTIFSGRLEFGTARSFEQVQKMFMHRTENYYRNDIILDPEVIFDESTFTLDVPRFLSHATLKSWRNTINLLEYTSQFAIAGHLHAWRTESGKMLEFRFVEPEGDKTAIQAFLKGRKLVDEAGKESEAKIALSRAIEKFERHALAYERRGYVNYRLKNYKDADYDFSKSIDFNPNNADPYFGRAHVKIAREEFQETIGDLEIAIKKSIPHQAIYWKSRRIKGDCHFKLGQFTEASTEYRMFTNRNFDEANPNFEYRARVFHSYGETLMELEEYAEAVNAFNSALEIEGNLDGAVYAERLLLRGIARQKAGQSDYTDDWKEAAGLGSKKAAELLEE